MTRAAFIILILVVVAWLRAVRLWPITVDLDPFAEPYGDA